MKLITFGCSWMAGDELGDLSPKYRNTHNLGYQIYKDYSFDDYINYSGNGASNERILIQLIEYINSSDYCETDLLVVGLSALTRKLDYLNQFKASLTIPHWDAMHTNSLFFKDDIKFKKWFDSNGYFLLNSRNELKRYMTNCLSIKSAINTNPCIVFQSIDNINNVFNDKEEFEDVTIHRYSHLSNKETGSKSCPFIDKKIYSDLISKNLKESQIWLNIENDSWETFLRNLEDTSKPPYYFASEVRTHPSEIGIELWYSEFIKKNIDKIFGSLK